MSTTKIPDELLSSGVGTGASKLLKLDSSGKLPAVDGSNLTGMAIPTLDSPSITGTLSVEVSGAVSHTIANWSDDVTYVITPTNCTVGSVNASGVFVVTHTSGFPSYTIKSTTDSLGLDDSALVTRNILLNLSAPTLSSPADTPTATDVIYTITSTDANDDKLILDIGSSNFTYQSVSVGSASKVGNTVVCTGFTTNNPAVTIQFTTQATYSITAKSADTTGTYADSASSNADSITIGVAPANVEALVVAGGGAGGGWGGGGGAGGYWATSSFAVGSGSITVTIGGGGVGVNQSQGQDGSNSVFSSINTNGGGGGGRGVQNTPSQYNGRSGGSGGGGAVNYLSTSLTSGGSGTSGQGNSGGGGAWNGNSDNYASGGGGGAGAAGGNGGNFASQTAYGGDGGAGLASPITGTSTYYAGGGGGQSYGSNVNSLGGAGGLGGGGAKGVAGTGNTGGGGGGPTTFGSGFNGGSGIVIIAYPDSNRGITTIPSSLTYSVSTSSRSGYRVYTFTAGTGSIIF